MFGIDTNVLVRHLVQDHPAQAKLARRLIEEKASTATPASIPLIVLCETAWVLSRAYGYSREQIAMALRQILLTDSFNVEEHALAWDALYDYQNTKADYADCLIMRINRQRGAETTFTFDKAAVRLNGFTELK